ncbi:L,D-transpeptidase [Actinoplanes sp. NPDC051859]|uniref:L,D-transpeptidase n=1 Tax=Actinoplanes sp. NPDC051859 TaxID=3363909 RepID=UPI0037AF48CE
MPCGRNIPFARVAPILLSVVAGCVAVAVLTASTDALPRQTSAPVPTQTAVPSATAKARPVVPAPADLQVIDYWTPVRGLPADPTPTSTMPLPDGLHPTRRVAVYDAPGGQPRAFLPPSISAMPVTVPIVQRQPGWVAVLLPSVNRTIGWLPEHSGWQATPLRDQLVLRRRTHELTWLRDGLPHATWTVATGAPATPTPRGRTFVLGRTQTAGAVYAGLDALVLGSVPDDPDSVPKSLRGGHTAFHSWHRNAAFGHSISNGCIRVPRAGQRALLNTITPGTAVIVLN